MTIARLLLFINAPLENGRESVAHGHRATDMPLQRAGAFTRERLENRVEGRRDGRRA
jgi:hypothetical protein